MGTVHNHGNDSGEGGDMHSALLFGNADSKLSRLQCHQHIFKQTQCNPKTKVLAPTESNALESWIKAVHVNYRFQNFENKIHESEIKQNARKT